MATMSLQDYYNSMIQSLGYDPNSGAKNYSFISDYSNPTQDEMLKFIETTGLGDWGGQSAQQVLAGGTFDHPEAPKSNDFAEFMQAFSPVMMFAGPALMSGLAGASSTSGFGFGSPESLIGAEAGGGSAGVGTWDYGPLASAGMSDVPQGVAGEVSGGWSPDPNATYWTDTFNPGIDPTAAAGAMGGAGVPNISSAAGAGLTGSELAKIASAAAQAGDTGTLDKIWDLVKKNPGIAVTAGGSLLSSIIGAGGSYFASKAQQESAQNAQNTLWNMYQQNRADLSPWREAGVGALGRLTNLTTPGSQFSVLQADPGYQWRLEQGEDALDAGLRARGRWDSGAALKEGMRYNQGFASNEFNNVFNRNASLAGLGQVGTTAGVTAGMNTANNVANLETQAGNARASGYMGGANAFAGGIGSGVNLYNQIALLEALKGK